MKKTKVKPQTHIFRGKKYKIFFRNPSNRTHLGTCDYAAKEIEVRPTLDSKDKLDVIIHESLHACFADIEDDAISETATTIANLLMKLGYKKG